MTRLVKSCQHVLILLIVAFAVQRGGRIFFIHKLSTLLIACVIREYFLQHEALLFVENSLILSG